MKIVMQIDLEKFKKEDVAIDLQIIVNLKYNERYSIGGGGGV